MFTYIFSWNYHCNLLNFFFKYELANRIPDAPYIRLPYVDWTQPPPKTPDPNLIPRQTKQPEFYTSIPLQVTRLNLPKVYSLPPHPIDIPKRSHRLMPYRPPVVIPRARVPRFRHRFPTPRIEIRQPVHSNFQQRN